MGRVFFKEVFRIRPIVKVNKLSLIFDKTQRYSLFSLIDIFLLLSAYFICKENLVVRFFCPDRHLFDEDLRSCNDYRKVYCANRPSFDHANDSCRRKTKQNASNTRLKLFFLIFSSRFRTAEWLVSRIWKSLSQLLFMH